MRRQVTLEKPHFPTEEEKTLECLRLFYDARSTGCSTRLAQGTGARLMPSKSLWDNPRGSCTLKESQHRVPISGAFKLRLRPAYNFYDGPPFATGLPHYGHILAGTIKVCAIFMDEGHEHAYIRFLHSDKWVDSVFYINLCKLMGQMFFLYFAPGCCYQICASKRLPCREKAGDLQILP